MQRDLSRYNLLTQRLLQEGWTEENYPDYVRLSSGAFGPTQLDNLYGGFEYTKEFRNGLVFKTGCGLLVRGSDLGFGAMFYNGIAWIPENNNPVITCPLRPDICEQRFSECLGGPIGGGLSKLYQCDLRLTEEPWRYEKSLRKVVDDEDRKKREKMEAFERRVKGHACHWHMHYDEWKQEWTQKFDPTVCARWCQRIGRECDLTGKEISKKRGHVFYDRKVTRIHNNGDLFDGQEEINITRGIRFLEHPTSVDICEQIKKRCEKEIRDRERQRFHNEIFLYGTKVEVINIRVEQRESRDLMQDLADLRAGIKIVYDQDVKKADKEAKKKRRNEAREKRIKRIENKILSIGYADMRDDEKYAANKLLGDDRINELEEERARKESEKDREPKQLSIFDYL